MGSISSFPLLQQGADAISQQGVGQANRLANIAEQTKQEKALRKVSREFESLFLNMMLKEMRDTVPKFDPLHSYAEDTYQELLDREWTRNTAQHRSMGLADMVYRQLSKLERGSIR